MAPAEIERLHERLDEVLAKLDELTAGIVKQSAQCEICGAVVLGNGKPSLDARVTTLETARSIGSNAFWKAVTIGGTIVGAVVGSMVTFAAKWWLGTGL